MTKLSHFCIFKDMKKILSTALLLILLIITIFLVKKGPSESKSVSKTAFGLDTVITITIYDGGADTEATLDGCFSLLKDYESKFSRTIEESDVYKINHAEGSPVLVSSDTYELVKLAVSYAEMSEGLVDPTIGSVSELWDFHSESPTLPDAKALAEAVKHVNYKNVIFDDSAETITLSDPEARLDLGFIAKGYIADRIKEYLIDKGVKSAVINLGGNVLAVGSKPDGSPFKIGIQDPKKPTGTPYTTLDITNKSVVSSGSYERNFVIDGINYHHILDPKTGYPVDTNLASASIITESSVEGDALSTYLFILGKNKAEEYASEHPDIEILLIPNK